MLEIGHHFEDQLTCTLHFYFEDQKLAQTRFPILEHKVGRLLINDYPTGVEVCDSMIHGGSYSANTSTMATSVRSIANTLLLRLVCYQNMPDSLLPSIYTSVLGLTKQINPTSRVK